MLMIFAGSPPILLLGHVFVFYSSFELIHSISIYTLGTTENWFRLIADVFDLLDDVLTDTA